MRGKHSDGESGIALVSALLLLAAMSAVTAAAVATGLYLMRETATSERSAQSRYLAESALNRTIFYLKNDVASHSVRTLGAVDYNRRSAVFVQPRFMADGVTHTLTMGDQLVPVTISDAAGGFALTPFAALGSRLAKRQAALRSGERIALEEEWALTRFLLRLGDYLDADDNRDLDGMERTEYQLAGRANLPRNDTPEYREELLWIPGAAEYWPDMAEIQLLPPRGLPPLPDEVRLYSSPVDMIAEKAKLTAEERRKLHTALEKWRTAGIFLEDSLSSALYRKITDKDTGIALEESGVYRVTVRLPDSPKTLIAVFRLTGGTNDLEFYEYNFL